MNKYNSTLIEASNVDQITKELKNFAENKVLWDKRAEIGNNANKLYLENIKIIQGLMQKKLPMLR